ESSKAILRAESVRSSLAIVRSACPQRCGRERRIGSFGSPRPRSAVKGDSPPMSRRFPLVVVLALAVPFAAAAATRKKVGPPPAAAQKAPAPPPGLPSLLGLTAVTAKMPVSPASASVDWVSGLPVTWGELEPKKGERNLSALDDRIRQLGEA